MPQVKKPKAAAKTEETARPLLYPEISVEKCVGETAMSAERVKELLGWEAEDKELGLKFTAEEILLQDDDGKNVRCKNNLQNRPLHWPQVETLRQEHLNKRWRFNGEPIIIGRTGVTLNGQHTMISFVLAEMERMNDEKKWGKEPLKLEKVVVYGVDESDDVVNTMDTCKPRSLWEVICRSEFFASFKLAERKQLAKICDYAVRLMWHRTGASEDAYAPRRTHSESLDFISQHPKLLACVKHIFDEDVAVSETNKAKKISRYVSPGTAAGIMYLMGCSSSDPEKYRKAKHPGEKHLLWDNWEKAEEFWTLFAGSDAFHEVRNAIGDLGDATTGQPGSVRERLTVIGKAWNAFLEGTPLTAKNVGLSEDDYEEDEDHIKRLVTEVDFGGIDLGDGTNKEDEDTEEGDEGEPTPPPKPKGEKAPENIEEQVASIRAEHPGKILLFAGPTVVKAWGEDAEPVAKALKAKPGKHQSGLALFSFDKAELKVNIPLIRIGTGSKVAIVEFVDGKPTVTDAAAPKHKAKVEEESAPEATPAPAEPEAAPAPTPAKAKAPKVKGPTLRGGNG